MKWFCILLALCPVLVQAQTPDLYQKEVYKTGSGFRLPYRILYPENYNPKATYPLVVVLHGVLERGKDNTSQLTNGGKLFLQETNRKKFPAIVIFPQCPEESYWAAVNIDQSRFPINIDFRYQDPPTAAMEACIDLIEKFVKEKKADRRRIYLMGFSMGGMGTLEAVSRYPNLFAAAVPMCGAGDTTYCERYAGKTALWLFHGAADQGISPEESRVVVRTLKKLGAKVRYTEYAGVGHNCWEKALEEPELLPWMFAQRIPKRAPSEKRYTLGLHKKDRWYSVTGSRRLFKERM